MSGADLANAALKYLGTPFHHQGRARRSGLDCIGLFVVSMQDIGRPIRDYANYKRYPDGKKLIAEVENQLDRVPSEDLQVGDIMLFILKRRGKHKYPQHIGIKTAGGFVHTYVTAKKVIETELDSEWRQKLSGVYRIRDF